MAKTKQASAKENVSLRGRVFTAVVTSTKMQKSAIVEWTRRIKVEKYHRYIQKKKRIAVHVPEEIKIQKGDMVRIQETRPLSKTKNFIIIENLGFQKEHIIKAGEKDDADQGVRKEKHAEAKETKEDTKKDSKESKDE